MAAPRGSRPGRLDATGDGRIFSLERDAHSVADRLPDLLLEADRIAQTVAHGIHGRRRAGPGETFWQFRTYEAQDAAQLIDWRRSASSDHLYVREREWEAAHTLWLWPDLSPSMYFQSHLSPITKRDRALVLMLASAELLVRGGERVGLLGVTQPTSSRRASMRLAEAIAAHGDIPQLVSGQPSKERISRYSSVILLSDFLDPIESIREHVEMLAAHGANGHLVQILDPAEETLPYEGRTEFLGLEGGESWIADRAESLRARYQARLKAHREELQALAVRLGWSFLVHHTDRPATEPLLTLIMRLEGREGHYRWQTPAASKEPSYDEPARRPGVKS
ncbi:MAG: DUF58 domain-containing protein [Hyphomicrobium sp.]|jgi:uncharacterized protein (DUF58 family)|uniref:DUF58 domain-containing protein n=1 Tax=Hyphomicrobium sp. TaxID=82 RepID=UPI0025C43E08|nr:DUF58 domain-containing protein [Hyphomicrobium sp.]MBX9861190.1 DUF58 domain-containing protein [Hyphomicrobium sp.]